jgi:hypothetical protein
MYFEASVAGLMIAIDTAEGVPTTVEEGQIPQIAPPSRGIGNCVAFASELPGATCRSRGEWQRECRRQALSPTRTIFLAVDIIQAFHVPALRGRTRIHSRGETL